jgi:hypothetical protein
MGINVLGGDPCSFNLGDPGGKYLMTVIHVDDFLVTGDCEATVDEFVALIEKRYTIQRSKDVEKFLGLRIEHVPNGAVKLSQPQLIEDLMNEYKLHEVPVPSVPMPATFSDEYQDDSPPCDYGIFMSLLGSLLFMVKTRPDIA